MIPDCLIVTSTYSHRLIVFSVRGAQYGGIDCQEIRLLCDISDSCCNLTDCHALLAEVNNTLGNGSHLLLNTFHRFNRFIHAFFANLRRLCRLLSTFSHVLCFFIGDLRCLFDFLGSCSCLTNSSRCFYGS